jgi:adenylate cyclase
MLLTDAGANRQRLAAILVADAAGYSRLMSIDEAGTVASLDAARAIFRRTIEAHRGRVIDMAGDSVLAVFETATEAVNAALAIQAQVEASVAGVPADRRMRFRIGVHMGDVTEKADGTIYGDGVNIAARLEGLALPGGVTVSDAVQGAVRHRIDARFEDLGEQQVKNIADPVRVYRVLAAGHAAQGGAQTLATRVGWLANGRRRWWATAALLLLVAGVLAAAWRGAPTLRLLAERTGLTSSTVQTGQGAPITMSLAIGTIVTSADAGLPASQGEALREDLLGGIGSVERLYVRLVAITTTPESSVYRDRARAAGVRYFIEGELRQNAAQRSVGLRLIDTWRGIQVWSNRFDLPEPAASFEGSAARRRLVYEVASAVMNAEMARVLAKPLDGLDAMELVMRAASIAEREQSMANIQEMRPLLERALTLDPTLIAAMIGMLGQVDMLNDVDPHPDHQRYVRETDQFSLRAVTLDPGEPAAWHQRAAALMLLGRWTASLEASDRGLQLDPYGSRGYQIRAWLMNMMGRPAEAVTFGEKALALDPSRGWALRVQCEAYLLLGESAKAIATCERASGLSVDFIHHSFLAAAYANAGDLEHARIALHSMLAIVPGYTIAQLKAKRYSDHPEYLTMAERYWYDGLRKAGLPEQ